jgi:spore coat protein CotH
MLALSSFPVRRLLAAVAGVAVSLLIGLALAGCGAEARAETTASTAPSASTTASTPQSASPSSIVSSTTVTSATTVSSASTGTAGGTFFDSVQVHEISVTFTQEDYDAMIATYKSSSEKDWIKATVTIDGVTYNEVGMRLKGNSSIMGLRNQGGQGARGPGGNVSADSPQTLPWLIRLDKFVDGQSYEGLTDLVVRSNTSSTSLNEAVALQLLDLAGLASLEDVACRFSVNGGDEVVRLVTQLPDDEWMAETFGSTGALYKAESSGDYSYRGDDPDSYTDIFDQEAGKDNADLTPLIEFLDFINNSDDATFAAELPARLDVDAFATYLAMEELLGNFDDIDGPGNNSYLYYDPSTTMFTVVPWDHNLAFGVMNGRRAADAVPAMQTEQSGQTGVGAGTAGAGAAAGADIAAPAQPGNRPQPGQGMMAHGKSNILVTRFHANTEFQALYEKKLAELKSSLFQSGQGQTVLDTWVGVLKAQASDLLDSATIDQEAAKIATYFAE